MLLLHNNKVEYKTSEFVETPSKLKQTQTSSSCVLSSHHPIPWPCPIALPGTAGEVSLHHHRSATEQHLQTAQRQSFQTIHSEAEGNAKVHMT